MYRQYQQHWWAIIAGDNNTGDKFIVGINNTGEQKSSRGDDYSKQFIIGVADTDDKLFNGVVDTMR